MAQLNDSSLVNDANLQGYWRFEDDYVDVSANSYDLTASGSPVFATGKFGKGLDLETTSSQKATIASAPNLNITGSQTWACWFKPESIGANHFLMSKRTGANHDLYVESDGGPTFYLAGLTTNIFINHSSNMSAGTWYFVVGRYNSATNELAIFLNGVKETVTASGSATGATGEFAIGVDSGGTTYADGIIDDAYIFNRALSDTEVNDLYTGISASPSPSVSVSSSPSVSLSLSPSITPSVSISLSPSISISLSPSISLSLSISLSPSSSASPSSSSSLSVSASPSISVSASPSSGYSLYSRGDEVGLPSTTSDLETTYTEAEETRVSTRNDIRVSQTGTLEYMIHQFKVFVGSETYGTIEAELQSTLDPRYSTVYLQVYNQNTGAWETKDSEAESDSDVDFELSATISDLTDYKDSGQVVTARIYQLAI